MDEKKRILILSDSLALPRSEPEKVDFEDTWVELLKIQFPDVIFHQFSLGAATIDKLWEQFYFHKNFRPSIVIIQCGINDCSPRALTEFEQILINSNRYSRKLGNIILPKIKLYLRRSRYVRYTSEKKFEEILLKFLMPKIPIIGIGIIPANEDYEKRVPGIKNNIIKYNRILQNTLENNFLDTSDISQESLMSDHHHLNKSGHKNIYLNIANLLYQNRLL
jgi:hypothetical protein